MEIIFSHFVEEDRSKSKLEKAIAQLPKDTFSQDGKCLVTFSSWKDGSIIKLRINKEDIYSAIKIPDDSIVLEKNSEHLMFIYKEIRYLAFHVNF